MSVFPPGRTVHAFLNIHSGWDDGSGCSDQLRTQVEAFGVALEIHHVEKGMDIVAAVKQAVADGCGAVIAGGGDGTLNAVAAGVRDSGVPMAILPIGTLNHLARDLRIPLDPEGAIAALAHSRTLPMDLGEVNGRVFINNSIFGLYPEYHYFRERYGRRGSGKWLAILAAIVSVFRFNPSFTIRMNVDGREVVRRTPYVLVANNEHLMEGYRLGERQHLDQGMLWVYVMRRMSRWGLLRMAFSLLAGRFHKNQDLETFAGKTIQIAMRRKRIGVALDGDVCRVPTPLRYRSLPRAITVIAPEEASLQAAVEQSDQISA